MFPFVLEGTYVMKYFDEIRHVIPRDGIGKLKDLAVQVASESARLEGSVAPDTAKGLGEQLRLLNSYHSNRIEGHKTGILDIRKALNGEFKPGDHGRYNQQLCAAHVVTERYMMDLLRSNELDPFDSSFLPSLHKHFYSELPLEHQYCHSDGGFTNYRVMPGEFRDKLVSVDGAHQLGPEADDVPVLYEEIIQHYIPEKYHGDEKLIAILSSHHRLTWLHPFRDGNGRMVRLHTTAAMANIGINRSNLWSLSRGISRDTKNHFSYEMNLQDADSFTDESLSDFILFCLEQCLDQIQFIGKLLNVTTIEDRIDRYFNHKLPRMSSLNELQSVLNNGNIARLMSVIFRSGRVSRGEAYSILGVQRKRGGEIIKPLLKNGLLRTESERGPLLFGFPEEAMPEYFPFLYKPSLMVDAEDAMEGILVRDGEDVKIALKDGSLQTIGPWNESFQQLLGKELTQDIIWAIVQNAPFGNIISKLYDIITKSKLGDR